MRTYSSIGGSERREHGRVDLNLPAKLLMADHEIHARVVDLSYGGAGVAIPGFLPFFRADQVRRLEIAGVGTFDVTFRWKTSDRMGLSFKYEREAREKVQAFFNSQGLRPD